jgi:hypothetical protein
MVLLKETSWDPAVLSFELGELLEVLLGDGLGDGLGSTLGGRHRWTFAIY